MTDQHPITPPLELVEEWHSNSPFDRSLTIATQAARWGADAELEACCEWLREHSYVNGALSLLKDRRPKPPSLKEKLKEAIYNENLGEALRLAEQLDDSL